MGRWRSLCGGDDRVEESVMVMIGWRSLCGGDGRVEESVWW